MISSLFQKIEKIDGIFSKKESSLIIFLMMVNHEVMDVMFCLNMKR